MSKKRNWEKKRKKTLGVCILGIMIGLGYLSWASHSGVILGMVLKLLIIPMLQSVLSIFLCIIIHELGHLIFGLLSGYRFVSFRVGSITLIRRQKKWLIKRFNIPGTGGQCLMAPPKLNQKGDYPFALYNAGGIAMNLLSGILAISLIHRMSQDMECFMLIFAVMSFLMFLTNGVPVKIAGVANDGLNLFSIRKDHVGKRAFYVQLDMNAKMSDGIRMKDMPIEWVKIADEMDLTSPINAGGKLFEYYWYADQGNFEKANEVLQEYVRVWDQMVPMIRNMIAVERIYLELIGDNRNEVINELLTKEVRQFITRATYDVHAQRVNYGIAVRECVPEEELQRIGKNYEKLVRQASVQAEAQMSWELWNVMIQRLQAK